MENLLILSPAGSGKSCCLSRIIEEFKINNTQYDTLCPTGQSSINIDGMTYHSYFYWNPSARFFGVTIDELCNENTHIDLLTSAVYSFKKGRKRRDRISELNVLIFDEFSMIKRKDFEAMSKLCQIIRDNKEPFGGIKIIVSGDPFQLMPVGGQPIYISDEWERCKFKKLHIDTDNKLPRFFTKDFSDLTRYIRLGLLCHDVREQLENRIKESDTNTIEIYTTNKDVENANNFHYSKLEGPEVVYNAELSTLISFEILSENENVTIFANITDDTFNIDLTKCSYSSNLKDKKNIDFNNLLTKLLDNYRNKIMLEIKDKLKRFHLQLKNRYGEDFMKLKLKKQTQVIATMNHNILNKEPIVEGHQRPSLEALKAINDMVNRKPYKISDWLSPRQFEQAPYSDCKGYAVTKYYYARKLGWKAKDLNFWSGDYIVHGLLNDERIPHMIVVANINGEQRVLDIGSEDNLPLAKDYFYKKFMPAYRFNENGWDVN